MFLELDIVKVVIFILQDIDDLVYDPDWIFADAVTILEQIEGALAYLDTVGTRAGDVAYKRMRLVMQSAHRNLHNRMHQLGYFHDHTQVGINGGSDSYR